MSDEVYYQLREFLDKLPGGYPATPTGVEIRILKKLFTPEQARITTFLTPTPEPVSAIAARLQMEVKEADAKLAKMAERGLIGRFQTEAGAQVMANHFVIGIYEAQLRTLDRELAELMEEYFPYFAAAWESVKTPQLRVVPVATAIDWAPSISSYDSIRELAKTKQAFSVVPCICRKEQGLMGNPCERPAETCIQFDGAAEATIARGGRRLSREEFMDLLKTCEEAGLVPSPNNAQEVHFICMCCGCCCGILRGLKRMDRPAEHVQSSFQAKIDPETCTACGVCLERCQMEAIKDEGRVYAVDLDRCIGCGLCVAPCPEEAVSLIAKPDVAPLPANIGETYMRISQERGLI